MTHVYFVEAVGLDRIKIGIAERPEERIRQFKTGCPAPVKLVGTIKCPSRDAAQVIEDALHTFFGNHKAVREWFVWNSVTKHFVYYFLSWDEYNKFVDKFLECADDFCE